MSEDSKQDLRRQDLLLKKERLLHTCLAHGASCSRAKASSFIKRLQRALRVESRLSEKSHKP